MIIGIHRSDIDLCSPEPMKAVLYTNRVKWSIDESHSRSTSKQVTADAETIIHQDSI